MRSEEAFACTYCGMPADSIDHIPPTHMREQLRAVELYLPEKTVHCCRECNCGLTGRPLVNVTERRAFIKQWLKQQEFAHNSGNRTRTPQVASGLNMSELLTVAL